MIRNAPTSIPPKWDRLSNSGGPHRSLVLDSTLIIDLPHCEQIVASSGFFAPQLTQ